MQSSNPVFNRAEGFNGQADKNAYGNPSYGGNGITYPAYGESNGSAAPYVSSPGDLRTGADQRRMSIDSVVQKTGATLGLLILSAAATWVFIGDVSSSDAAITRAFGLATAGALIGFALAMVNSFKRVVSPALVLAYAVVEGVFVGALSKVVAAQFDDPGIVIQAVLGTFVAFAGTLAAYKFFNITVTDKFRRGFTAVLLGFVGLLLVNWVLSMFGIGLGLRSGMLGIVIGTVALVLGVICLIMDFDFVERGIAAGLPERESWRAAFGLTVTLVWIYIEMLRLLALLRGE